jgi:hypothetical protein
MKFVTADFELVEPYWEGLRLGEENEKCGHVQYIPELWKKG